MQGNILHGNKIQSNGKISTLPTRNQSQAYLQADEKFFWNLNVSMPFIERNLGSWTTPIANIWTETKTFTQNQRKYNLTLVSRRGSRRQGPRYIKRGVDKNGDVANFVETEQILRSLGAGGGDVFTFTQIRGSIPLYWEQVETWRLKPLITPDMNLTSQYTPLRTHLSAMCSDYCGYEVAEDNGEQERGVDDTVPDMVFVNLIDKKGRQGALGACLSKAFEGLRRSSKLNKRVNEKDLLNRNLTTVEISKIQHNLIMHIWFDYHSKCAGGKTSSLGELMPLLDPITIGTSGYLHINRQGKIVKKQNRIIRTNCIDCLDRTNVMQSNIARRVLQQQLSIVSNEPFYKGSSRQQREYHAKYIPSFQEENLEKLFREIWGDNGDNLSMLYAGTRALKRDVTRKGKRTRQGVFDDGVNSAKRYFINNFKDPRYQRALDIILGGDVDDTSSEKLDKLRQALRFKKYPVSRITDFSTITTTNTTINTNTTTTNVAPVKSRNRVKTNQEEISTSSKLATDEDASNVSAAALELNSSIVSIDIDFDPKEMKHKPMAVGKKKRGETEIANDQILGFKEQITDFYKKYNPSKIADIPNILHAYKGKEMELLDKLRHKYMTTPTGSNNHKNVDSSSSRSSSIDGDDNNTGKKDGIHEQIEKTNAATSTVENFIPTSVKHETGNSSNEAIVITTTKNLSSNSVKSKEEDNELELQQDGKFTPSSHTTATSSASVNTINHDEAKKDNKQMTRPLNTKFVANVEINEDAKSHHNQQQTQRRADKGKDSMDVKAKKKTTVTVGTETKEETENEKGEEDLLGTIDELFGDLISHWKEHV